MKVLHTADVHLDYSQYGMVSRREDFMECFRNIGQLAIDTKVDAVVLAGDTLDNPNPDGSTIEFVKQVVSTLSSKNIPVLGVVGNHDADPSWLRLCGITDLEENDFLCCGVNFTGVGYKTPSKFLDAVYDKVTLGNRAEVFVIHQAFQELHGGGRHVLSIKDISQQMASMGVKYVAMGDIHVAGETTVDGVVFAYPGSPETKSSDDNGRKTVNLVEIKDDTGEVLVFQLPTTARKVVNVIISSDEELEAAKANNYSLTVEDREPIVHITYTPEFKDGARRIENELATAGCIVRSKSTGEVISKAVVITPELYKGDAGEILQDVIGLFFDENSDERKLVTALLGGAPIEETVSQYVKYAPKDKD